MTIKDQPAPTEGAGQSILKAPTTRRDALDRYYTPQWVTEALLDHVGVSGNVLEPCAGTGGVADVLERHGLNVVRCDIDRGASPKNVIKDFLNADSRVQIHIPPPAWVITNPPYATPDGRKASDFVRRAINIAPRVAMLLRLSWLEPCGDRIDIFTEAPPSRLVILPRISFKGPGGRGKSKTDSVTSAWVVWDHDDSDASVEPGISWGTRADVARIKGGLLWATK